MLSDVVLLLFDAEDWARQTTDETGSSEGKHKCAGQPKKQRYVANETVIASDKWLTRWTNYCEPCCSSSALVIVELQMAVADGVLLFGENVHIDMFDVF